MKIGRKLRSSLSRYRRRQDLFRTVTVVMLFVAAGAITTLAAAMLFSPWFFLLMILPVGFGVWYLTRRSDLYELARRVERHDASWKDRLSTAVDLSLKCNPREVYSPELTADFVERVETRLDETSLSLQKEQRLLTSAIVALGVSISILITASLVSSSRFVFGMRTIFARENLPLKIAIDQVDTVLDPGEEIELTARVRAPVELKYLNLEQRVGERVSTRRVKIREGIASAEINVDEELEVSFERFGHRSGAVHLTLNRPFEINEVEFTVTPPTYTGEKPRAYSGLRFSALPGSRVRVEGTASTGLEFGNIVLGEDTVHLDVQYRDFTGEFDVGDDREAGLMLTSSQGSSYRQAVEVVNRYDEVPLVVIFLPGEDTDLNREMMLTLGVHAIDDYGLGQVRLVVNGEDALTIANSRGKVEDTFLYRWDLGFYDLLPGDQITYYVEAADNDAVTGPNWGRSRSFTIRFPRMSQMFAEIAEYGSETAGGLSDLSQKQEELSMELARIEEKLRAEQVLSSEEQARLQELISEQRNLMADLDSLAASTRELAAKLEQGMLDPATLEQMSALTRMLSQLMPPELAEKLAELSQAISSDPERLAELLDSTGQLSSEMQGQLEQALAVLERFLQEQRLGELAQKASALAEMEAALIREAGQLSPREGAARQEQIEQGIRELADEASQLSESLSEQEISDELRELADQMSGENTELSQSVEESIGQGNMNQRSARNLERNLREAGSQLSQMAFNLGQQRQQQLTREMATLARELLVLSEEQENLLAGVGDEENLELAARATELERAIERKKEDIFQLASQSFSVPRDAMHKLATASRNQSEFKQYLIEGQTSRAADLGKSAQYSLDQAASSLLEAYAQSCGGQSSSTGLEEMMQSLSQMSLAQMSINQSMGGLLPLPITANMSEAQRQALGQLAAEQGALRQQLEQLQQSAGQEPGLSGMLEGLIEDMASLEQDLSRYVGERELVDRGEQIFRKLLDARNVLRKQEDTERREREIGTMWVDLPSPSLSADAGERRLAIKKELLRFIQSEYPEEYKRLARDYLEALLEEE